MSSNSQTLELARRFLCVLEALVKLARHRMPEDIEGQLALSHLKALYYIQHQPGISQKDLAEQMALTPAAVSIAVRNLESLDLVARSRGEDTRMWCLHLSERGAGLIKQAMEERRAAAVELLSALSAEEQRMIVEALERAMIAKGQELNIQL